MPSSSANIRDIVGVDDFVLLENVESVEDFMKNLSKRFHKDIIYTYIGQVLISVNPYKELSIYHKDVANQYKNVNTYEAKPHIFAIAATSYRSMIDEIQDQCILISGESGSGKTEASKKILEYITYNCQQSQTLQNVKDKLLSTNPVLEVFGNAKTARNNNSSRFGKYMDIEFNRIGQPIGGHINIFMLEKSRVIYQNANERNFHIFYQILRGLDDQTLKQLQLIRDIDAYFYLNQTTQEEFENIPNQFETIQNAFKHFDFSIEEEQSVYKIISSILHLGNIGFYADDDDSEEKAVIANVKPVTIISNLLDCDRKLLASALTSRAIEARNETVLSSLNREQAIYGRDALAKAIYERLFFWLVSRLNSSLKCINKVPAKLLMGLVDIYGFEVFQTNHFEQFCINYCNEKLQQLFIELTLKQEQEEYRREKIDWEPIKYFNNKIICDMIEEKHQGIIAYLDEECFRPGEATDFTFLNKLQKNLATNPHFNVKHNFSNKNNRIIDSMKESMKRSSKNQHFTITHYAGDVEYNIIGFIDKNNDQLHRDLKKAMISSKNEILSKLFHVEELNSLKRPNSTATQFRNSLAQLMILLSTKQPWYIRCIKPNEEQIASVFDKDIIAHQIQYLGLMENLRVRRAGFAYRRKFEDFLQRYKCICSQTWPHYPGPAKDGVKILMKYLKFNDDQYKLGLTKIFIRFPQTFFNIEDALQQQKHVLATKIQALYRGYRQRLIYEHWKLSAIQIQSYVRRLIAKKTFERRKSAVETVRRFIKGFINRTLTLSTEENEFFLRQVKIEWLRRLARNLPKSVLDSDYWIQPTSASCVQASELLLRMHRSYLARKYVHELSRERKEQFTEKLFAEQLFKGKKFSYLQSIAEPFQVDRVGLRLMESNQTKMSKNLEKIKMDREKIQYISFVHKYDRHGYKMRERILIITDKKLYLFDSKNYSSKESISLSLINSVVLSNRYDCVFLIKISPELKKQKGDLILESSPRLIELITKLVKVIGIQKLVITNSNAIQHSISGGKEGKISFLDGCRNEIIKKKSDGTLQVMSYDSSP